MGLGGGTHGKFTDHRATGHNLAGQTGVARGINAIRPAAQHRHGLTGTQGATVGGAIDTARKPAGDHQPKRGQILSKFGRKLEGPRTGSSTPDNRNLRGVQGSGVTLDEKQRRRIRNCFEGFGVTESPSDQNLARRIGFEPPSSPIRERPVRRGAKGPQDPLGVVANFSGCLIMRGCT
jgi:hypothetical protein